MSAAVVLNLKGETVVTDAVVVRRRSKLKRVYRGSRNDLPVVTGEPERTNCPFSGSSEIVTDSSV